MPPKAKRLKLLQESARRAREGLKKSRKGEMADNVRSQPFIVPLLPPPSEDLVSDCSSDASYDIRKVRGVCGGVGAVAIP